MSNTATNTVATMLKASTFLPESQALAAIVRAAGSVAADVRVAVTRAQPTRLECSVTTGSGDIVLCTFSAHVTPDGTQRKLRVGGLETFHVHRRSIWDLVSGRPRKIPGVAPYARFLERVADELTRADPGTLVVITQPRPPLRW